MQLEYDSYDEALHGADFGQLERRIMDLALDRTRAHHGGIFLWDRRLDGLTLSFHMVDDVVVPLPQVVLKQRDDRPNGIALHVVLTNRSYLCDDTRDDPHYAPYFLEVGSIVAVPIQYQDRAIGALTVSAEHYQAFHKNDVTELETLATSAAKFLRRDQLYRESRSQYGRPLMIKGLSAQWLEVERQVEQVAPTTASVLIQGESGTGKELVATSIHFNSRRYDQPLVVVNCAAIPENMLESILFGHMRGAFTGATVTKIGEFRRADRGTLFLDEVGELSMLLQAKVLRAVEHGEILPLGSDKGAEHVDVRVICATNRDLASMVRNGDFRDDLYYRISVITMALPPLRDYRDNLPIVAKVALTLAAERYDKRVDRISPEAMALLTAYRYPGNMRELKNAIEHGVIMAKGDAIGPNDLPKSFQLAKTAPSQKSGSQPPSDGPPLKALRESWLAPHERQYLKELMAKCDGNVRLAAKRAGINVVTMYKLLAKRGLKNSRIPA